MNEEKHNSAPRQSLAPKSSHQQTDSYLTHALVFLGAVLLVTALGWILPGALNMRESVVERYLMGGFAVFLIGFLFWLK